MKKKFTTSYNPKLLLLVLSFWAFTTVKAALPVITVIGANPIEQQINTPYTDLGATAVDENGTDITLLIQTDVSQVDVSMFGSYIVTYTVSDVHGNVSSAQRTVVVTDKIPPVLSSVIGSESMTTCANDLNFSEPIVTAADNYFSSVTVTRSGTFNISVIGTYTITYTATDGAGNTSTYIRTITVKACQKPIIIAHAVNVKIGDPFDPFEGVSVWDSYYNSDDFINNTNGCSIAIISIDVNPNIPGVYQVCYQATNGASYLSDPTCRIVMVSDKTSGINALGEINNPDILIYPNPNKGLFEINILSPITQQACITINNINGQVIKTITPELVKNGKINIDITDFDSGMYFIKIQDNKDIKVRRIVITK